VRRRPELCVQAFFLRGDTTPGVIPARVEKKRHPPQVTIIGE